jgi:hypothetical protein
MSDDWLADTEPPERNPDFRRVGKDRIPMVRDEASGKMVRYRRASSAGKILDDDYNLWDWKRRTDLVGAAQRPELMAEISTLNPDQDKKRIRDIVEMCLDAGRGNARSTQGSAVHSMFDHVDLGHDWVPAPQFQSLVDAYIQTCEWFGLVSVDVEAKCVNDRYRIAGTLDRRYRTTRILVAPDGSAIPIGSILVGDTKTGTTLEYASGAYATQLAAYVDSVRYDPLTDERIPFSPPNHPDWAVIIHAVPELSTCAIYWVDIQAGHEGLRLAEAVREWRKRTDLLQPAQAPQRVPQGGPVAAPSEPLSEPDEPEAVVALGEPSEALREAVAGWLRGRVQAIRAHSDIATQKLQRTWPAGVPGLKQDGHSWEQLGLIEDALDSVEAEYSVPFGETDPRALLSMANHPSNGRLPAHPITPPIVNITEEYNKGRNLLLNSWLLLTQGRLKEPLTQFAHVTPEADWSDEDLAIMLQGTLRAIGYEGELRQMLPAVSEEEAPVILSAAFAISTGNAVLRFDAADRPLVTYQTERKGAENEQ